MIRVALCVIALALASTTTAAKREDIDTLVQAANWEFPILILGESGEIRINYSKLDKFTMPHKIISCYTNYEREHTYWRCVVQPENGNAKLVTIKVGDGI